MTSEHIFCCYNRSAIFFFLGMCRANIFYSNFFSEGEGGGGIKIGSICVSP